MADERTRYSDAELEEFKQLILKKLENARADYELLRATITHTACPAIFPPSGIVPGP